MLQWIGIAVGIAGIIYAVYRERHPRVGTRLDYQERAIRLIGHEETALPETIEILSGGKRLRRLTKYYLVLWNSGSRTIERNDVVESIRAQFKAPSEDDVAEVVSARVLKATRDVIGCQVEIPEKTRDTVEVAFDYLDAGDGATIEVHHTSPRRYPKVLGVVKGMPKGLTRRGTIPSFPRPFTRFVKPFTVVYSLLAGGLIFLSLARNVSCLRS